MKYCATISIKADSEDEARELIPNSLDVKYHPSVGVIVDGAEIDDCDSALIAIDGEDVD